MVGLCRARREEKDWNFVRSGHRRQRNQGVRLAEAKCGVLDIIGCRMLFYSLLDAGYRYM